MTEYSTDTNSTKDIHQSISPPTFSKTFSMQAPQDFSFLNEVKGDDSETAVAPKLEPKAPKEKKNLKLLKSDDENYIDEPLPKVERGRKMKDEDPNAESAARLGKRSAKAEDKQVRSKGAPNIT